MVITEIWCEHGATYEVRYHNEEPIIGPRFYPCSNSPAIEAVTSSHSVVYCAEHASLILPALVSAYGMVVCRRLAGVEPKEEQ